ncbi:unnamed protein product [Cylindrotheca closterium]|uniref:Uncharacterized protein n=1 Tax=Cylindrotheca closterium TaxID=2856 RepID=A0AAD2CMP5_9STRA|nr:unnamed protein product [Cylindrotheca closterium]
MMKQLLSFGLIALLTCPNVQALLQGNAGTTSSYRLAGTALQVSRTSPDYKKKDVSSSEGESEAEKYLRLARKLRQQAAEDEQQVHERLYQKKREEDEQLDEWIQNLSLSEAVDQKKNAHIVNALKERKPCMETLERIVERLHEHHMIASGLECVEAPSSKDASQVNRVIHEKDDVKVQKIDNEAEALFQAIDVLDSDQSGASKSESRHWGGDGRAIQLRNQWKGLQREHEDQFLKRQASFIEAQRLKKENPPPPKVKDDHRFLP